VPHDHGQGRVELDDLNMFVVKRPDPTDCELVQGRPKLSVPEGHGGLHGGWSPRRASQRVMRRSLSWFSDVDRDLLSTLRVRSGGLMEERK
jgi:hypothetical protein